MLAIPDAQPALAPLAGLGADPQAGQQSPQHGIGIGWIPADEGAHADAVAPLAGESPTKTVPHQAEFKMSGGGLIGLTVHLHRNGFSEAGSGGAQAMGGGQGRAGAIGDQHRLGLGAPGLTRAMAHQPPGAGAIGLQALHPHPLLKAGPGRQRLLGQKGIEAGATHDPEGGIAGQWGNYRILQAPGEAHLVNHPIHRRQQIKREQPLHRCSHAATAGLAAGELCLIHQQHAAAGGGQMKGSRRASGAAAHHHHLPINGHT